MTRSHSGIASIVAAVGLAGGFAGSALAQQPIIFSTGGPDFRMATATRAGTANATEIEAADDFLLTGDTRLTGAKIVGLIPAGAALGDVQQVTVEIYRLFPLDSDTTRTARVPTRGNSPSDVEFDSRDSTSGDLSFTVGLLTESATALNSVVNGINPSPDQNTLGEGPVSGRQVQIHMNLANPIDLPPGHYFFVPQVTLASGNFLWLSSAKPIVAPGTPFMPDLQAWIRSERLAPDWLRVGADIVGGGASAPAFNMSFLLEGTSLCYANCDDSTSAPELNVADFTCFLQRFAKGDRRANCDQSTTSPTLNVADFTCFLQRFAAGCP